jgi:hypothetical protein
MGVAPGFGVAVGVDVGGKGAVGQLENGGSVAVGVGTGVAVAEACGDTVAVGAGVGVTT